MLQREADRCNADRRSRRGDPRESWLLEPKQQNDRDDFWSPGIKIGTQRGGYTHQTEFFGPVLAVMRVADLPEALAVVKETGYGLTLGVESLERHPGAAFVFGRAHQRPSLGPLVGVLMADDMAKAARIGPGAAAPDAAAPPMSRPK